MNCHELAFMIEPLDSTGDNAVLKAGFADEIYLSITSERILDVNNSGLGVRTGSRRHADAFVGG
jgi:hypothetical protein